MFPSYLNGYAALGPAQVFMDTGKCSSLAHYSPSCFLIYKDIYYLCDIMTGVGAIVGK